MKGRFSRRGVKIVLPAVSPSQPEASFPPRPFLLRTIFLFFGSTPHDARVALRTFVLQVTTTTLSFGVAGGRVCLAVTQPA